MLHIYNLHFSHTVHTVVSEKQFPYMSEKRQTWIQTDMIIGKRFQKIRCMLGRRVNSVAQ